MRTLPRRVRLLAVAVAAIATVGVIASGPVSAAGGYSGSSGPRVALWGDSISNRPTPQMDSYLTARVTAAGFQFYGETVDSSTIRDHFANVTNKVTNNRPDQAIIELGTGDARDGRSASQMRSDIRSMLTRLRPVGCVRWLNVKEFGVNGIYAGVVANAGRFNQVLREVKASGEFPNFRIVDYNLWAYFNRDAFSADGLHFNAAGADRYARWIANSVAGC